MRSTLCTISFNPEKLMCFPFNSIDLTETGLQEFDRDLAKFQLATACHVSGRNVTFVRLSVFLKSCQVNFLISCNFGQCSPHTITAGLRSLITVYTVIQVCIHSGVDIRIPDKSSRKTIPPPKNHPNLGHWFSRADMNRGSSIPTPALQQTRRLIPRAVYSPPLP